MMTPTTAKQKLAKSRTVDIMSVAWEAGGRYQPGILRNGWRLTHLALWGCGSVCRFNQHRK